MGVFWHVYQQVNGTVVLRKGHPLSRWGMAAKVTHRLRVSRLVLLLGWLSLTAREEVSAAECGFLGYALVSPEVIRLHPIYF